MVSTLASDTFTGTNGAAWSSTWALGQDNTGSLAQIQSNVGRMTSGSAGGYAGQTSRKVNLANFADGVWLMKFRWPTGDECYPQIWMRASNDILDSQAGYVFELNRPASLWAVTKVTAYSGTTLSSGSFSYTSNTYYWVRCGAVGSALKFKIWADGASEPGAWTYEVTDTTYASSGRCGLRLGPGASGSAKFEVDDFTLTDAFSLAFSDTAPATGSGALTVSGIPTPKATPGLAGTGVLTTAGVPKFTPAVGFTGSGTLVTTRVPAVPGSVALSGTGQLSAAGTPAVLGGAAGLTGSGALSALTIPALPGVATLAGGGTLMVVAGPAPVDTAARTGSGTLVASGVPEPVLAALMAGLGTLVLDVIPALPGAADQTSEGTLTASVMPGLTGSATRTGSGTLAAAGAPMPAVSVDLPGSGVLAAIGSPTIEEATVDLSGSGQLGFVGVIGHSTTFAFTASGQLSTLGVPKLPGVATLAGSGTLTTSRVPRLPGLAGLSGSGALTAAGSPRPSLSAVLGGSGGLVVVGTPALIEADAVLSGTGTLAARPDTTNFTRGVALLDPPIDRIQLGDSDDD